MHPIPKAIYQVTIYLVTRIVRKKGPSLREKQKRS